MSDYRVYFLILAPLLGGCMASDADVLTIADRSGLGAEVGYVVTSGDVVPGGDDKLKVGQVCPICNGEGKVGDGRVFVDCHTCGGDGRIDERDLEPGGGDAPDGDVGYGDVDVSVDRLTKSRWTWTNRGTDAPISYRREHLVKTHGVNPATVAELDGDELNALHDNLHSTGKSGLSNEPPPMVKVESAGSSCPSGNCPGSSGRSSSSSRRGIFGGLFRRR